LCIAAGLLALSVPTVGDARAARLTALSARADNGLSLTFDGPVNGISWFALSSPGRLVIDMPGVVAPTSQVPLGGTLAAKARVAQFNAETARLVVELNQNAGLGAVAQTPVAGGGTVWTLSLQPLGDKAYAAAAKRKALDPAPAPSAPPAAIQAASRGADTPSPTRPGQGAAAPLPTNGSRADLAARADKKAPDKVALATATPAPAAKPVAADQPAAIDVPATTGANAVPIRGRRPVIVVDAGHGGQDPGAKSVLDGRHEKEATLAIARAIRTALEEGGRFKVILTRDADHFIPLGERVDIARRANADLFLSIHADSIADPDIRGATVYTLSETASDKEAERLAAKENKADIIAGINLGAESPDVTNILIDLAQRETMNYSAEFASHMVREVSKDTFFRSNFHRYAGFRVLKAADVPSVLFESGYMSNKADSTFLFDTKGQRQIAQGVRRAIEGYFSRRVAQR